MTRHTWSTAADVPPAAWAAMCAEMRELLAVTAGSGAQVTAPDAGGPPVLDGEAIAFTVLAPGGPPLTVRFSRAAGAGEVHTAAALTGGLVVAALERAGRHFGALLTTASDADTTTRAVAARLVEVLFDAGDRALIGLVDPAGPAAELSGVVARAQAGVNAAAPSAGLVARLGALIAELEAERAGRVAADTLLSAPAPPAA